MNEKREQPRSPVQGVEVYDPKTDALVGQVHNMTPYGLQVKCQSMLEEGHFHAIELRWEKEIEGHRHLAVDVLGIWSEESEEQLYCGTKLLANAEDIALLVQVVELHSV